MDVGMIRYGMVWQPVHKINDKMGYWKYSHYFGLLLNYSRVFLLPVLFVWCRLVIIVVALNLNL